MNRMAAQWPLLIDVTDSPDQSPIVFPIFLSPYISVAKRRVAKPWEGSLPMSGEFFTR